MIIHNALLAGQMKSFLLLRKGISMLKYNKMKVVLIENMDIQFM